jgi:acyl-coenzyme A thioesterase PaaI-like protein
VLALSRPAPWRHRLHPHGHHHGLCATIHLDIQYTSPAKGKRFTCASKTVFRTGRIHFMQGEVRDGEERLVAMAQGTFRVIKAEMRR